MTQSLIERHRQIFGVEKPVIGCLHLMPLPGTPYYNPDIPLSHHIERLKKEARTLVELGYDAVVFANEGDRPYLTKVGPEIIAAYVRIVSAVLPGINIPYGCGVLIDPMATIAVAKAIDAKFVRTYVSNSYEGTFGSQKFNPAEIFRYRKAINAENINVYTYFEAHAGVCLDTRSLNEQIGSGFAAFPINGMLIGGPRAGLPPEASTLSKVRESFSDYPLILGSGATVSNVKQLLQHTDGVIVGTTIKKDGYLYNEIDYERAKDFISTAHQI